MREIKHRPYTLLLKNLALWLWSHVAYASVVVAAGAAAWFYNIDILMWQSQDTYGAPYCGYIHMVYGVGDERSTRRGFGSSNRSGLAQRKEHEQYVDLAHRNGH